MQRQLDWLCHGPVIRVSRRVIVDKITLNQRPSERLANTTVRKHLKPSSRSSAHRADARSLTPSHSAIVGRTRVLSHAPCLPSGGPLGPIREPAAAEISGFLQTSETLLGVLGGAPTSLALLALAVKSSPSRSSQIQASSNLPVSGLYEHLVERGWMLVRRLTSCTAVARREASCSTGFSVSPTHDEQENSVWNGHYACACYHPLFVFKDNCVIASIASVG